MSASNVLVISSRRLLVDALKAACGDPLDASFIAVSGDQLAAAISEAPDALVVIDLEAPGSPTHDLVRALARHTGVRRGVYDQFTTSIAERAFELGVGAPVPLTSSTEQLVRALGDAGTTLTRAEGLTRRELDRLATLSPRELQVIRAIALGHTTRRTATWLGVTPHTVDTHRRRAMRKLEVNDQAHAVSLLARAGVLRVTSSVTTGDRGADERLRR